MTASMRWSRGLLLAALSLASACSQILGIEDAYVDPALAGSGGSASVAGAASPPASLGNHDAGGEPAVSGGAPSDGALNQPHAGSQSSVGSASSSSAGAASDEPDLCERYCDQVTRVCKGKYEQYRTFDQCVRVCQRLPPGEMGDKDTNTASCRMRQAELAEGEPFVYCKSAGPLGEGKCGSNCISYCGLMQQACTVASTAGNLEPSHYSSSEACLSACTALPEAAEASVHYSTSALAEPTSFVGNNVFCRTYHVAAAIEQDAPDEHCPHAMGGDPCIN